MGRASLANLVWAQTLLLRLPVGRGGVLNSPRFCFFFFDVESRATAQCCQIMNKVHRFVNFLSSK